MTSEDQGVPAVNDKILEWFCTCEVGSSSKAMACCIAGIETTEKSYPYDPSDLFRCVGFLFAVPEARNHLDKLRSLSPEWNKLVDRWDELERLLISEFSENPKWDATAPKTYALMKEIMGR